MKKNNKLFTVSGTDIEEVKKQNAHSGLTYNEVFQLLAERNQNNNKK